MGFTMNLESKVSNKDKMFIIDPEVNYLVVPQDQMELLTQINLASGNIKKQDRYNRVMDVTKEFLEANLTPVILFDPEKQEFYIIVKEYYGKILH